MTQKQSPRATQLPVDLYEGDDHITVLARLPGVRPEDLEVRLEGDQLTLSATRHEPVPAGEGDHQARALFRELGEAHFSRQIRLRSPIDADGIDARLELGLLQLRLPKAEAARPRVIEVRAG